MLSTFSFWIWGTIIAQLLTAFFHSLSFISPAKPRNDKENNWWKSLPGISLIWAPVSNEVSIVYLLV